MFYTQLDKFALVLQLCVNFANALNPGGRQVGSLSIELAECFVTDRHVPAGRFQQVL